MTQDRLRAKIGCFFVFDLEAGKVYHRIDHGQAIAGREVGWIDEKGYRRTKLSGKTYFLHKLIWLHAHGEYPSEIDHKDGNKGNNALSNLRVASRSQNLANANVKLGISGTRGVYVDHMGPKWRSAIYYGGQRFPLGVFDTVEEASTAYKKAAHQIYGEFAFHNRKESIP